MISVSIVLSIQKILTAEHATGAPPLSRGGLCLQQSRQGQQGAHLANITALDLWECRARILQKLTSYIAKHFKLNRF